MKTPLFTFSLFDVEVEYLEKLSRLWGNLLQSLRYGTYALLVLSVWFIAPVLMLYVIGPILTVICLYFGITFLLSLLEKDYTGFLSPLTQLSFSTKFAHIFSSFGQLIDKNVYFQIHAPTLSFFEDNITFEQGESLLRLLNDYVYFRRPALTTIKLQYSEIKEIHLFHHVTRGSFFVNDSPHHIELTFYCKSGDYKYLIVSYNLLEVAGVQQLLRFLYSKKLKINEINHKGQVLHLLKPQYPLVEGEIEEKGEDSYYEKLIDEIGNNDTESENENEVV